MNHIRIVNACNQSITKYPFSSSSSSYTARMYSEYASVPMREIADVVIKGWFLLEMLDYLLLSNPRGAMATFYLFLWVFLFIPKHKHLTYIYMYCHIVQYLVEVGCDLWANLWKQGALNVHRFSIPWLWIHAWPLAQCFLGFHNQYYKVVIHGESSAGIFIFILIPNITFTSTFKTYKQPGFKQVRMYIINGRQS